jgi:dihydropteroate synthase
MTSRASELLRRTPRHASGRVAIVGILNVTPDSFSDGGRYLDPAAAAARAERMVEEGADAVDIGGESTRPGATPVPEREEIQRVVPVVRLVRARLDLPISIDTSKAAVARAALDEGADMINDVSAGLFDATMLSLAADRAVPISLMHMQGRPADMQRHPVYPDDDVVAAVQAFLQQRIAAALATGVPPEHVIVDPGIGFGKTTAHNLTLISRLDDIAALGYPVLIGPSRKRFIGAVVGGSPEERFEGTAAAVALSVDRGADLIRVHDVAAMVRVVRLAEAVRRARQQPPGHVEETSGGR